MMVNSENYLEKIFNVIKLLQKGMAPTELTKAGYEEELVSKCVRIRNYLYVCNKNEFEGVKR